MPKITVDFHRCAQITGCVFVQYHRIFERMPEKVLQNGYKCAIIRAVRYRNEPSFLPWGTASFYQKQCRFLLQCRRSGQRETQKLDRLFPTTVGFAGQCTLLQRIRASLLPRFSLHRTTALPTDRTACFGCRTSDAAIDCCIRT